MPIGAPPQKTARPDIYKSISREARRDAFRPDYSVPYKEGDALRGQNRYQGRNTYLIVPNGVTLRAKG